MWTLKIKELSVDQWVVDVCCNGKVHNTRMFLSMEEAIDGASYLKDKMTPACKQEIEIEI